MQADLTLPLIKTGIFGIVGNTSTRSRINPLQTTTNVAVSGATLNSLLNGRANALSVSAINTETDLVMYPRQQTQIEYVESVALK